MDIQGLIYLLNRTGNTLAQANERIEQLTAQYLALRSNEETGSRSTND